MHRLDFFPNEDLVRQYRSMMSGKAEDAMLHMIFDLGVFEETKDESDIVLKNYGIRLLKILGGGEVEKETIREFIKRLSKQPLKQVGDRE